MRELFSLFRPLGEVAEQRASKRKEGGSQYQEAGRQEQRQVQSAVCRRQKSKRLDHRRVANPPEFRLCFRLLPSASWFLLLGPALLLLLPLRGILIFPSKAPFSNTLYAVLRRRL